MKVGAASDEATHRQPNLFVERNDEGRNRRGGESALNPKSMLNPKPLTSLNPGAGFDATSHLGQWPRSMAI